MTVLGSKIRCEKKARKIFTHYVICKLPKLLLTYCTWDALKLDTLTQAEIRNESSIIGAESRQISFEAFLVGNQG